MNMCVSGEKAHNIGVDGPRTECKRKSAFNVSLSIAPLSDKELPEVVQEAFCKNGGSDILVKSFAACGSKEFEEAPAETAAEAIVARLLVGVNAADEAGSAETIVATGAATAETNDQAQLRWSLAARTVVVQSLRNVMLFMGLEYKDWCLGVLIVDIFYKSTHSGAGIEALLPTFVALIGILDKAERCCGVCISDVASRVLPQFMADLQQCCPDITFLEATSQRIRTQERALMSVLHWRVLGRASAFSWLQITCARLNILSCGSLLAPLIPEVWSFTLEALISLLDRCPTCAAMQPRRAANGSLALCLVRAGILFPDTLRHSSFEDAKDWQDLVWESIDFFAAKGGSPTMSNAAAEFPKSQVSKMVTEQPTAFLKVFLTSACVTFDELCEDVCAVVLAFRQFKRPFRRPCSFGYSGP